MPDTIDPFGMNNLPTQQQNGDDDGNTDQLSTMSKKGGKKMVLITFVIDNSLSMEGAAMNALNDALMSTLQRLEEAESSFEEGDFRIAMMTFTNNAQWIMEPCSLQEAARSIPRIQVSPGNTYYSSAFKELNSALSLDRFMAYKGKKAKPIIIFMTDGAPHPIDKYDYDLENLNSNGWYATAYKSAILMGDAATDERAKEACRKFVGPDGGVISTTGISEIIDTISTQTIRTLQGMPDRPASTPGGTPAPAPTPAPTPAPAPAPFPTPDPAPAPAPAPFPTPDPVPAPAPAPAPFPTPDPVPAPTPAPAPFPTPDPVPAPAPAPAPLPTQTPDPAQNPSPADPFGNPSADPFGTPQVAPTQTPSGNGQDYLINQAPDPFA